MRSRTRGQGRGRGRGRGRGQERGQGRGRGSDAGGAKIDRMRIKKVASKKKAPKKGYATNEEGGMARVVVDTMPPISKKNATKGNVGKGSTETTLPSVSKDTARVATNPPPAGIAEKPSNASPDNYPSKIRAVGEEDLYDIASFPIQFSTLASVTHRNELSQFMKFVFGFTSIHNLPGVNISNQNAIRMKNIAKGLCSDGSSSTKGSLLDFKPFGPKTAITADIKIMNRLLSPGYSEYMSETVINIFGDMLNLLSGAHSSAQTVPLPGVVFVRTEDLKKMFDLSPCNRIVISIFISDAEFPRKVHLSITEGLMKTVVGDVLKVYKSLNISRRLKKILSVMRIQNSFLSVCIDFRTRMVTTHHPKSQSVDSALLRRKWIAKTTSIADFYINKSPYNSNKEMYFGAEDMKKETFLAEDVPLMPSYLDLTFSYFHRRSDNIVTATPSNLKFPTCEKVADTALLSVWNCFIHLFEWEENSGCIDIDFDLRKRQFYFRILVIRLYIDKMNDASYVFEDNFEFKRWLLHTQWPKVLRDFFSSVLGGENEDDGGVEDDHDDASNESNVDKEDLSNKGDDQRDGYVFQPFMQCDAVLYFIVDLSRHIKKQKYWYFSTPLDAILQGVSKENINKQGVKPKFSEPTLALGRNHPTEVTVNVHWNFQNKSTLIRQFQDEVCDIFNSTDDADGIEYVLNKKSTFFVSIQAKSFPSDKSSVILCFAAVTCIRDNNSNFKCLIVDYFGTSKKDPKDVLNDYDYVSFTGKGLGKLMINLLQCLSYVLSATKTTKVLLKNDDEKANFYTTIGFTRLNSNHHLLNLPSVINRYDKLDLSKDLKSYILMDSVVIEHLKSVFINHVYHPLSEVAFAGGTESFVPEVHSIFDDSDFLTRVRIVPKENVNDPGAFDIPIGEVVAQLFQKFKPPEYAVFSGLYESLIKQLCWNVSVVRRKKKETRTSSVDDLKNPVGSIYVCCGLCHDYYETPFVLDKKKDQDINTIKTQVMAMLEYFFDNHFQVSNKGVDPFVRCEKMKISNMKNIRDCELQTIGYISHLSDIGQGLFEKLLLMFQQGHLDMRKILKFWDWENFRGPKYSRVTKLISNKRRRFDTVNAVLGLNESRLRESNYLKNKEKLDASRRRKTVKDWESLSDDFIFLKHMRSIMYVNKHTMSIGDFVDLKSNVSNPECFNDYEYYYYVGFPGDETVHSTEESKCEENTDVEYDSDGNRIHSGAEETSDSIITEEIYEDEDAVSKRFEAHDQLSYNGMARCLNWKWLKEHVDRIWLRNLKEHENRRCNPPQSVFDKIKEDIANLRVDNINYIYKYTCPTTYAMKFCNAVPKRRLRRNQVTAMENYEIMFQDEVSRDWLFSNAVVMNNCTQWFNDVMDPKTTDKVFAIPVAAVSNKTSSLPEKVADAPLMKYPQYSQGICGVSAFSSAFHFAFSTKLSHLIFQGKEKYLKSLSRTVSTKKSPSLICLTEIMFQKAFREYAVTRKAQIVSWKKLLENPFYSNIMLCIPKSTSMVKDHIIDVTNGWIFDGNLVYAIPLNESNLTWCTSHGKTGEVFTGFCEQLEISLKDLNFTGKTKSAKRKRMETNSK